jgi:hypothetical protein
MDQVRPQDGQWHSDHAYLAVIMQRFERFSLLPTAFA